MVSGLGVSCGAFCQKFLSLRNESASWCLNLESFFIILVLVSTSADIIDITEQILFAYFLKIRKIEICCSHLDCDIKSYTD